MCINSNGKVTAKPSTLEYHKNLDFIVKLPAEQAVFSTLTSVNRRSSAAGKQPITSRRRKMMASVSHESSSLCQHTPLRSMVQRAFSSRAVGHQSGSQSSDVVHQSSSDSQYSQSERSYSFTDSMEIAGFTSDSSLESFKGVYDENL